MPDLGAVDAEALQRVRAVCLGLPGTEEGELQDRPLFRVGRRRFAIFNGSESPPRPRWASSGRSLHFVADPLDHAALSQDGRFVLFHSIASDVVSGDTNGCMDIFLRDRQSGAVECVSLGASGQWGNADSVAAAMTPDARFILFFTHASNLGMTDTNEFPDLYLRDRGLRVPQRTSALVFLSGFALSITPGKVGEFIKSYLLRAILAIPIARSARSTAV